MKVAFIGVPQSGKTTLAAAVTGVLPEPGGAPQITQAVVKVPDPRLHVLARMHKRKKTIEATIVVIDVPGFSLADHKGRDDFERFLPELRQSDLLVAVIREFDNPSVPAYRDRIDAEADLSELREELVYADLHSVGKRLEKVETALKKPTKSHDQEKREHAVLTACNAALENVQPLSTALTGAEEQRLVSSFGLLTLKPLLLVHNVSEADASRPDPPSPEHVAGAVNLCASAELEICQLEPADRQAFLDDLGVADPARDRFIHKCYEALGLVSFLTIGADEVRAWTVQRGTDAVQAAGKVHSDMARGFIRAETVAYHDLIEAGDMKTARANAKVRQEGKSYTVQDGDVINFKFNV